jgi:hypothetical protein
LLQFQSPILGTGGNDIILNFDTSQAWGSTTASIFIGHVLVVNVKNDGTSVLDSAATVASVINSTPDVNGIIQVTNSPGSDPAYVAGINTATQVVFSGGSDPVVGNPAVGGDLRYTATNLYVGQTDTTWKSVEIGPPAIQQASDAGSLDIDLSLAPIVQVSMNGSIPITAHNMVAGTKYTFVVSQIGGSDLLGWDTNVFKGATAIGGTGTSVQEFICMSINGGPLALYATGPGAQIL